MSEKHPFWAEFDARRKDAGVTQTALSVAAGRCSGYFAALKQHGGKPHRATRQLLDTALELARDDARRSFTGTITADSEGDQGNGTLCLLNLDTGEFDLDVCLPFDLAWPVGAKVRVTVERVWTGTASGGRGSE